MFLTCVARRRNSRPSARSQSTSDEAVQVAFRLPADSASTLRRPDRVAEVPERVDVVVLGERRGERVAFAGDDVDDAARHVRGVEHLVEVGRARGWAREGTATTRLPMAIAGMTSETKASSGASSGQTMPMTPHGSFIASVTWRERVAWTAPSYLSAKPA